MRLATVFSGIGAPEQACRIVFGKAGYESVFACDNGERELDLSEEEIEKRISSKTINEAQNIIAALYSKKGPNKMKMSYLANYQLTDRWYEDVRFIDGSLYKGKIDLFIGGSPCQSFSNMGHRKGLEDARGTLFFNFANLVNSIQPKVFIYENVPGMMMIDKGETWKRILAIFKSLPYHIAYQVIDSKNHGIPQRRERIYVVGIRKDLRETFFEFPQNRPLIKRAKDFLEPAVDPKYYFKETGYHFVLTHPGRARVNREIIGTQRANQQFNWNGDFIFEPFDPSRHEKAISAGAYVGFWKGQKGLIRKLTPRECLNLMGFQDFNIVVNDHDMWRQAGNSMVVNVLVDILKKLREEKVL